MFSYPQGTLIKSILTTCKFCEVRGYVINLSSYGTFHQNILLVLQCTKIRPYFQNYFDIKIKAEKLLLILLTQSKPVTKQPAIRSVQFRGVDSAFLSKLPEELV